METRGVKIDRATLKDLATKYHTEAERLEKEIWQLAGGRFLDKDGYVMILSVDHPNKNGRGYVQEHRLVIEKKIGRYLNKEESVHHKNKNKQDNSLENLMLFKNISAHRRFESGGIVNAEEIIFNYEINLKAL
jgi:uncharacterized protein (DUF1330 family)